MVGCTDGIKADPGSIRGDYSTSGQRNLVHASDSEASAEREMAIFFKPEEIVPRKIDDQYLFLAERER